MLNIKTILYHCTLSINDSDSTLAKKRISQPPLNLLFNPSLLNKEDIWKIDVVKLLEMLLQILKMSGNKDLRVCGVAILTSALIHRLKVESIFRLEKVANQKNEDNKSLTSEKSNPSIPIPELINIPLPFRKETEYPVSLEDLLVILENMITEITNPIVKRNQLRIEPVETIDFQQYLVKFEQIIEEYESKMLEMLIRKNELIFESIVMNEDNSLEIARYFIAMLYLAMKGKIDISVSEKSDSLSLGSGNNNQTEGNPIPAYNSELIKITLKNN